MLVCDKRAEKLEMSGLWRRATGRWLVVLTSGGLTDEERDWIRRRRNYCLSQIPPVVLEKIDMAEISRAAKAAQVRMGLNPPNGAAFRQINSLPVGVKPRQEALSGSGEEDAVRSQ